MQHGYPCSLLLISFWFFKWHKVQCFISLYHAIPCYVCCSVYWEPSSFPLCPLHHPSRCLAWFSPAADSRPHLEKRVFCSSVSLTAWMPTPWVLQGSFGGCVFESIMCYSCCDQPGIQLNIICVWKGDYTFSSFFHWILWVRGAFMTGWTWWVISTSMSVSIIL